MRDIYAKARQVIVWLGDDDESDEEAFDFLNWLATSFNQNKEDQFGRRRQWLQIHRENTLQIEHTIALLQRPWFTRTWVVQEVASAQKAILVNGHKTISWEDFWTATSRLWDPLFEHSVPLEIFRAQRNIWAIESAKRSVNGMSVLSLHKLLLATHSNDCSDARDKVFAILGLATDWLEKGGLDPDYRPTTTAEEVFRRYAMWDVKNNRSLRILSFAGGRPETPQMPSWAPDWRIIDGEDLLAGNKTKTKFSASEDRDPDAWFSDHGRVLNAVGQVVDTIKSKGPQPRFSILRKMFAMTNEGIEEVKNSQKWLQECLKLAVGSNEELTAERYAEFWRTLNCGLTHDGFPAPAERGAYVKKYLDFLNNEVSDFISTTERKSADRWFSAALSLIDNHPEAEIHALVESDLWRWAAARLLCTTEKGRLASVPKTTQEGDLICILYGGDVPYILRPLTDDEYMVVGECYVDDIMHGKALTQGTMHERQFKLV